MKHRFTPYLERTCEAGMACMLTMVQGNLLALTLTHWLIASQTGLVAGAIASTTVVATRLRRPWLISLTLGGVTIPVDALVHPGKFEMGGIGEAVVTGVGAFVLSLAAGAGVRALARRRARQTGHDQSDPLLSPTSAARETLLDPGHAVGTAAGRDRARDFE